MAQEGTLAKTIAMVSPACLSSSPLLAHQQLLDRLSPWDELFLTPLTSDMLSCSSAGGGGGGGDDDDDDFFNDEEGDGEGEGEAAGTGFFRALTPESYDKLSIGAVLAEWMKVSLSRRSVCCVQQNANQESPALCPISVSITPVLNSEAVSLCTTDRRGATSHLAASSVHGLVQLCPACALLLHGACLGQQGGLKQSVEWGWSSGLSCVSCMSRQ